MYDILFSASAEKSYLKVDSSLRERIDRALTNLENGRFLGPPICALHGLYQGSYRYRIGEWRIVFQIDHDHSRILIASITTRGGAYKK